MPRSDLLLKLIDAGSKSDRVAFRRAAEAVIAEERAQHHDLLAERLEETIRDGDVQPRMVGTDSRAENLVHARTPHRHLSDLYLSDEVSGTVGELIEEHHRSSLLRSHNLEPRHRLLLIGPPGNGKTSLAEAIAYELALPLFTVRYDQLIASFLGETASRVGQLFDFVRSRECVLFFDEFDAIAKERGDPHDTGEVKRVVSSLVLNIDELPSHVFVVTATNHPELLDRAVWRRFQVRLALESPTVAQRTKFIADRLDRIEGKPRVSPSTVSRQLAGLSFAELEDFLLDVQRKAVLSGPPTNLLEVVQSRLRAWKIRRTPTPK